MEAPASERSRSWRLLLRVKGGALTARGWGPLEYSACVGPLWGKAGRGLLPVLQLGAPGLVGGVDVGVGLVERLELDTRVGAIDGEPPSR